MACERRRPQAQAMTTPLELWAKATESQELREQLQEEEWAHKPIKKKGTVAESLGQWSFVNKADFYDPFRAVVGALRKSSAYGQKRTPTSVPTCVYKWISSALSSSVVPPVQKKPRQSIAATPLMKSSVAMPGSPEKLVEAGLREEEKQDFEETIWRTS